MLIAAAKTIRTATFSVAVFASTFASTLLVITTATSTSAEAAPCWDVHSTRQSVESLTALGPRPDGSSAARRATELIEQRLLALGLEPRREIIGSVEKPKISVGPKLIDRARTVTSRDENIWVRFGGDAPARLFIAHYDTVPTAPGAVDNAVAVAILLELAKCFATDLPPPGPVILAFTGAEEIGLIGARRLAKTLEGNVELAVSLDLVGNQTPIALNGAGALFDRDRLQWLANRVDVASADAYVPLVHRLVSRKLPSLERSDHGAFTEVGVPAFHLYGRGPNRIFLPYHTAGDDLSQVENRAVANALALTYELAIAHDPLPKQSRDHGMWLATPLGPIVVSGYAVLAAEIVLAIAAALLVMLCWARRRRAIRERAIGVFGVLLMFAAAFLAVAIAHQAAAMLHGNPLVAIHSPLRYLTASLALSASIGGLIAILINRYAFFIRGTRYHAYAAFITLVIGVFLIAVGATELAWQPLLASACFALAGFLLTRPYACSLLTLAGALLSLVPLLWPALIREAYFHGFYPPGLPIAAYLALIVLPTWLAVVGALRARLDSPPPNATLVLVFALFLAGAVATAVIVVPEPLCTGPALETQGLACELR